jgi:hypothetical protein
VLLFLGSKIKRSISAQTSETKQSGVGEENETQEEVLE